MKKPTTILLIRHAHSSANLRGILAGRDESVALSARGVIESQSLADYLHSTVHSHEPIARIVSSPLLRAKETIEPFRNTHPKIEYLEDDGIVEMDYGLWSGRKLSQLSKRSLWQDIQRHPSRVRFPEGESFLELATRSSQTVENLSIPGKTTLFVSHGDVIKVILAYFLGLPIDHFQRLVIEPASFSKVVLAGGTPMISHINSTSHLGPIGTSKIQSTLGGGSGFNRAAFNGRDKRK